MPRKGMVGRLSWPRLAGGGGERRATLGCDESPGTSAFARMRCGVGRRGGAGPLSQVKRPCEAERVAGRCWSREAKRAQRLMAWTPALRTDRGWWPWLAEPGRWLAAASMHCVCEMEREGHGPLVPAMGEEEGMRIKRSWRGTTLAERGSCSYWCRARPQKSSCPAPAWRRGRAEEMAWGRRERGLGCQEMLFFLCTKQWTHIGWPFSSFSVWNRIMVTVENIFLNVYSTNRV
jgi:hypothetical protein